MTTPGLMHDRLSVSGLCFPRLSAVEVLREVAAIGASHTTMPSGLVETGGAKALRSLGQSIGVDVAALIGRTIPALDRPDTWPDGRDQLMRDLDLAVGVGASVLYMLTGSRNGSLWSEAVDRFDSFIGPCLTHAREGGVQVAVEPANVLYADLTFVHSLASATELARRIPGTTICLDLFHTWTEPGLKDDIDAASGLISLVQVGDYVPGDRSLPARAVPGDGGIPFHEIIWWLDDAGYSGIVDLELNGPRIDAEGHRSSATRGAQALDSVLRNRPNPRSKG